MLILLMILILLAIDVHLTHQKLKREEELLDYLNNKYDVEDKDVDNVLDLIKE